MKIAYFTDTYEPQINGIALSIKLDVENLRKRGHEVHIFCPYGPKKNKYIHTIFSKRFRKYSEYMVGVPPPDLIKEIIKIKPDIIHLHTPVTIGLSGLIVAKLFNIPIIASYRTIFKDYINYIVPDKIGVPFITNYTRWFFNNSSIIITHNKSMKRLLKKNKIKKPIKILPAPINPNVISKKFKKKNKKLTILYVGRLCKEKRIEVILDAFKDISKKMNAELIIIGEGPNEKELRFLSKKYKINKNVRFKGYLKHKELKGIYSTADIFVSASKIETHGLVVLEAMANGCPVIAGKALGFKEIIKHGKNGFLFDNKSDLSEKIMLLSKNKKLRDKLIKESLKTAEKYNYKNYIKSLEKIYYNLYKAQKRKK